MRKSRSSNPNNRQRFAVFPEPSQKFATNPEGRCAVAGTLLDAGEGKRQLSHRLDGVIALARGHGLSPVA